ncbi:MAG: ABC transporter substrate-binding protein [Thermotogaceae bacterium]|nr:ABC transporter substrate-binding protein [Thermotogaceae bacterium]
MRRFLVIAVLTALLTLLFSYPLTLVDDLGRVVTINSLPHRVVSAAPAATRYLIYLNLQEKVVGVTSWDILNVEKIGNMVPLNIEKIVSLRPDVVLTFGGFQAGEIPKLEKFGLTVFAINPTTLTDILRDLVLVGTIFSKGEEAKQLADELQKKMLEVAKKAYKVPVDKRLKVLYLMGAPDSGMKEFWTAVTGSYMNDLITLAGGRNIAGNLSGPNGWAPVSLEYIVKENPDAIIVASFIPGSDKKVMNSILSYQPFSQLKAVKNKKVLVVDGNVANQPSPQIFKLLEEVYRFLYEEE